MWRIERKKLVEAVADGHPATELAQFLESRAESDLPATFTQLIEDVAEKAEALKHAGPAILVGV